MASFRKRLLYLLASRIATRIRSGPLEGSRWTMFSGIRFVRGDFEPQKTAAIIEHLKPGDVFWDIGANVGYLSLLASKIVGDTGKVMSLEPSPVNFAFLKRNIAMNGCRNVTVFNRAASSGPGQLQMDTTSGRGTHHVVTQGDTTVEANSIDAMIAAGNPAPTMVKIDVEGFELEVLAGMKDCLGKSRPKMVLAVHSDDLERDAIALLATYGYTVAKRMVENKGDVELLMLPQAT